MAIIPCEESQRFHFCHELYLAMFFHMKKRGAILFKNDLKSETLVEKNLTIFFAQTIDL